METTETKIAVHEAVCAERYRVISERLDHGKERMQRIEYTLYIVIAAVLFGPGVAAELIRHIFKL
tara:strand:+ start:472 stop:666 length:195 start_codon:yes stop_codon:yes gene_type:complete